MEIANIELTSPAFSHGDPLPRHYTCDGFNISPPLHIGTLPDGSISLALIMEDPDAPDGIFDHWVVWNIDITEHTIPEGKMPGISGNHSAGKTGYYGPCPPSGTHRYFFMVYALDTKLDLPAGATKAELQQAMQRHIIGKGSLMCTYARKTKSQK